MFLQWISSTWKERVITKKKCFSPLHPHVEPIFPSTVALLQLDEKIGSTCGWRGGKGFFLIISTHFKNFVMSSSRWIHNNVKRRRETLIIEFCPPEISKGYYYIYYFFKLKASCFLSLLYTKNETQNLNCKLSSLFNFLRTIIFLVSSMTDS